jgi:hypothetical protein
MRVAHANSNVPAGHASTFDPPEFRVAKLQGTCRVPILIEGSVQRSKSMLASSLFPRKI